MRYCDLASCTYVYYVYYSIFSGNLSPAKINGDRKCCWDRDYRGAVVSMDMEDVSKESLWLVLSQFYV